MPEDLPAAAGRAGDSERRLVLHIGLHKTGTTYLQNAWRVNRDHLEAAGVYYPGGEGQPVQRMAAWDLLGRRPRGVADKRMPGQWQALSDVVAASSLPTALLSEEGLSVATNKQVARCLSSFPDREIHVLVTCRDLGRVVVSAWQEDLKNGKTWTWQEFISSVKDPHRRAQNPARGFWRAQDLPVILQTWRQHVPEDRIHVVTVPPTGADPAVLVERIASVVGFDPTVLTEAVPWDNASLGVAGTEVIRRLNTALGRRLNQRQHGHLVNAVLVPHLVRNGADERYGLPAEDQPWVESEAGRQIDHLRDGGYDVVGDLAELMPKPSSAARRPDEVTPEEYGEAATLALAGLAERHATMWWRRRKDDQPAVPPDSLRVRWGSSTRNAAYRTRRAGASMADRNRVAASALAVYLKVSQRGSSSPPR